MIDAAVKEVMIRDLSQYVGSKIRYRRKELKMTLDDLAAQTGITKAALCRIENGQGDVKLSTLAVIRSALALDISINPL